MPDKDIKYRVAFSLVPHIGRVRLGLLEKHFGSLANAWQAAPAELKEAGLDSGAVSSIKQQRPKISPDDEMTKLDQSGASVFCPLDPGYPARLKEIYDYPPVLYVKGSLLPEDDWCLGVVGTRRASVYGRQVTGELVAELVRNRITVASGLARGIDAIAHQSALATGGRTIAVLASGLDIIYPAEHASLAKQILENGALISEYPLGTRPRAEYFPRRNRILSGISLGVLVVEAGEKSGALLTAHHALEQNREVFAVPGNIFSQTSQGTNHLIQEGAKLVRGATDILEELNLTQAVHQVALKEVLPETDTESRLLKNLSAEPVHIDEVCRASGLPVAEVSATLAMMELKGMVRQVAAMSYVLARELREEYRARVD
ncbi:MAG: DNA-protecting protein DprA [Dehalococcoidia bacterium]|jgi:DNA processing protein|nr:MAG: DNA-protecting protein DprA [Dehalococcoidia bacterium]